MTAKHTLTDERLHELLAGADPLHGHRAADLPLDDAEQVLLRGLLAEAPSPAAAPRSARRSAGWRSRFGLLPRLALAAGVAFAALMVVLSFGGGGREQSGTAWAAELVRFAEASPLVLLDRPGWHVEYADEQSPQEGEMSFSDGPRGAAREGDAATLHWRGGTLGDWVRDRAASASVSTTAPVLGASARVFQYDGGRPGHRDVTALWRYRGRVLEFRAGVPDVAAFKVLLASLRAVDTDTWLSALPGSAAKAADRPTVVAQMLRGVTLPPGFDPASIRGDELVKDRYQLGATVAGTVACTWFARWSQARRDGDDAATREAIAAMATARDWPILAEMEKSGAYPEVLRELAAAMPSGRWYGRPLEGDANSGLGCPELGVPLPAAPGTAKP